MNGDCLPVFAKPWLGGYHAHFKLVWRTDWYQVQHWVNGKKINKIFPTKAEAIAAAWEAKYRIEEPHINGWVSQIEGARARAEALFQKEHVQ